jgi:hypothetical protein
MAVTQNVGDVIQVLYQGLWHGQRTLSTFKYGVSTLIGTPSVGAFASGMFGILNAAGSTIPLFLGCCPPQYFLNQVLIQTIAPTRVVSSVFAVSSNGTFGMDSSTANLAGVITRRGQLANKKNRGSLHVPLANLDTAISNGTIGAAYQTALGLLSDDMLLNVNPTGLGTCIPVLLKSKGLTSDAIPLVSGIVQLTVRVMRRRTVGVGK